MEKKAGVVSATADSANNNNNSSRVEEETKKEKVNDYLVWSLLSLLFCNVFCLGWVAVFYSLRSRFSKHIDVDEEAATGEHFGQKAKECNIQLLISGSMVFSVLIVLAIIRGMVYYYTVQNSLASNSTSVSLTRGPPLKC